jgi:hypothetical protein
MTEAASVGGFLHLIPARKQQEEKPARLEHDPEKWVPVFRKDHAQIKEIERDDDSKKRHPALGGLFVGVMLRGSIAASGVPHTVS